MKLSYVLRLSSLHLHTSIFFSFPTICWEYKVAVKTVLERQKLSTSLRLSVYVLILPTENIRQCIELPCPGFDFRTNGDQAAIISRHILNRSQAK